MTASIRSFSTLLPLCLLGVFIISSPLARAQTSTVVGDVDANGNLTPADALQTLQHALGLITLSEEAQGRANVDVTSSDITLEDAICIFQQFLGLPSCLTPPVGIAGGNQFISREPGTDFPVVVVDGEDFIVSFNASPTQRWTLTSVPPESVLTDTAFSASTEAITTFRPDVVGLYVITLTITTAQGETSTAVTVSAQEPFRAALETCNCAAATGEVVEMSVRVTDADGEPVSSWPVAFARVSGDGVFLPDEPLAPLGQPSPFLVAAQRAGACTVVARDAAQAPIIVTCLTDVNGIATARYLVGEEPVHFITARAQDTMPPVIFRIAETGDNDGDCLPNALELLLNLLPDNPDSNADGIRDSEEDFDVDGLSNCGEVLLDTDARQEDSDNDGISDNDEDADSDALADGEELLLGTNPFLSDTDGDGVSDQAEVSAGSDPLDSGSTPMPRPFILGQSRLDGPDVVQ